MSDDDRKAAIAAAKKRLAEAEAELRQLQPDPLRDAIASDLREGAAPDEIAEVLGVSERTVQRVAVEIGLSRGRGRPPSGARAEAIRLYKEGVAIDQIASQMGRPAWRIVRFLGDLVVAETKIDT